MRTAFQERVACSLKALVSAWIVSGLVFVAAVQGPGTVAAWVIWAPPFFAAGWLLVGLPFVLAGDRIARTNAFVVAAAGGMGGVLIMELPALVFAVLTPGVRYAWLSQDFRWLGAGCLIGASAAWLYRRLLRSTLRTGRVTGPPASSL